MLESDTTLRTFSNQFQSETASASSKLAVQTVFYGVLTQEDYLCKTDQP